MGIRPFVPADQPRLVELTIETFGPFFEEHFRALVGDRIFEHQHGHWARDYRDLVPTLHDPAAHKYVVVAERDHGTIAGYAAYGVDPVRGDGRIEILAVATSERRGGTATALCERAFAELRELGAKVVEISTGADPFHAPARALYERLGCTKVPITAYLKAL